MRSAPKSKFTLPDIKNPFTSHVKVNRVTPENCYGLLNINNFLNLDQKMYHDFLSAFFAEVRKSVPSYHHKSICVMMVDVDPSKRFYASLVAAQYGIQLNYSEKLSAVNFTKALKEVGEKGGVCGLSDVKSLLEALRLNSKVLILNNNDPQFATLNKNLFSCIVPEWKNMVKVILGLENNYDLLKDRELYSQAFSAMRLFAKIDGDNDKVINTFFKSLSFVSQPSSSHSRFLVSHGKPAEESKQRPLIDNSPSQVQASSRNQPK